MPNKLTNSDIINSDTVQASGYSAYLVSHCLDRDTVLALSLLPLHLSITALIASISLRTFLKLVVLLEVIAKLSQIYPSSHCSDLVIDWFSIL